MAYLVTFLEGVITFVSPCLLPMLPIYLAYFAGGNKDAPVRRTLACALCFVCGFGLVFTLMGAFAGMLGSFFVRYQRLLDVVCGVFIACLGLGYLGVLRLPGPFRGGVKVNAEVVPRGLASSFAFGLVFAVGWTPCVGTFLASALSLAASAGSAVQGIALLVCYTVGLGLPFVLAALLVRQLEGAFQWVRSHYELVNRVCGIFLVVVGLLVALGFMGTLLRLLS